MSAVYQLVHNKCPYDIIEENGYYHVASDEDDARFMKKIAATFYDYAGEL